MTSEDSTAVIDDMHQPTTPAIDSQVLDDLKEQLGDDDGEMTDELIGSYLTDATEQIDRLLTAARTDDAATVLSAAHTLRSTSALVGASPLVTLLLEAEGVARTASSGLAAVAEPVEAEFARVVRELNERRPGSPTG
jgi:HPt (histidine-containing phosphotransfer) domain-containing protein